MNTVADVRNAIIDVAAFDVRDMGVLGDDGVRSKR